MLLPQKPALAKKGIVVCFVPHFLYSAYLFYIEANAIEIDDAPDATKMSIQLSDYQSTLITSAPPQSQVQGGNQLSIYLHCGLTYSLKKFHPIIGCKLDSELKLICIASMFSSSS